MAASAHEMVLSASGLGKTYAQPVLGEVSPTRALNTFSETLAS